MRRADAAVLTALALVLGGGYAAAVFGHYLLSDDYAWLAELLQGHPLGRQMLLQGRPLYAWLLQAVFPLAGGTQEIWRVRLVGLAFLFAASAVFYGSARRAACAPVEALAGALIVAFLPALQVSVFFATAFCYPLAVVLAGLAFRACDAAAASGRAGAVRLGASLVLLSGAMLIYQTAATAFVAFAALAWLAKPDAPQLRARIVAALGAFLAACAAAYAAVRVVGRLYPAERIDRAALLSDPVGKIRWFLAKPVVAAFDLARVRPSLPLALAVAAFVVSGVALWLRLSPPGQPWRSKWVGVCALIPLSYLPNLVIAENWFSFRTLIGTSMLVVVLAIFAIRGWVRTLGAAPGVGLAALAVWAAVSAGWGIAQLNSYVIRPARAELGALESGLLPLRAEVTRVCLIGVQESSTLAPMVVSDEFGRPATSAAWAQANAVIAVLRSRDRAAPIPRIDNRACPEDLSALTVDLDTAMRHASP
jgi:hypothetical protein